MYCIKKKLTSNYIGLQLNQGFYPDEPRTYHEKLPRKLIKIENPFISRLAVE